MKHSRSALALITVMLTALAVLAPITAAQATGPVGHTELVPQQPRTDTPRIEAGDVEDMVQWGDRIVLAGNFTQVENANGQVFNQSYIVAYDIDTGQVDTSFMPTFDRPTTALAVSADGNNLFVAGSFNNINGVGRRKIVKLNWNGSVDTQFQANANSRATAVAVSSDGQTVYMGGFFARVNGVNRGLLAAVDADTGAVDPDLDIPITEGIGANATLKVQSLLLTPDDGTLIVVHTGARVDGELREAIALIDTNTKELLPWQTDLYTENLPRVGGVLRVNEGDIAPDGTWFAVVSGSGGDRPPINDTVIAWPIDSGAGTEPLWVSRHFDSLLSIAITEYAAYIGGHFRWQEAPGSTDPWPGDDYTNYGWDSGIGAAALGDEVVRRDQIGALDPATGKSLPWNPGSSAFQGVLALEAVARGLLVSHDSNTLGGIDVGYHGFFDWESVAQPEGPQTNISDPFSGETLDGTAFLIAGSASDESGVNRIQIDIRNNGTGEFLQDDLVTFASGWNSFDVDTLDDPGATYTAWSQSLEGWETGTYRIQARTWALDGTRDESKAQVTVDVNALSDAAPSTTVTYPGNFEDPPPDSNTFTITGTAADDIGVASVRIVVRNIDTDDYLQPDMTVSPDYATHQAIVDPVGEQVVNWWLEVTVPDGYWQINANATDTSGNVDNAFNPARVLIDPTNEEPMVTIDSPAPFFVFEANTSIAISGTAWDDTEVAKVSLNVINQQTTYGIQANGTYGVVIPVYGVEADITSGAGTANVTWELVTPELPPGMYMVQAWGTDDRDITTEMLLRPLMFITSSVTGDAEPDTTLDQEGYDQDKDTLGVSLSGTATDDNGVTRVAVVIQESVFTDPLQGRRYVDANGDFDAAYVEIDAVLSGSVTNRTWSLSGVTLPQDGDYTITVKAVDSVDQYDIDQMMATARWLIYPGDPDPYTWIQGPNDGDVVDAGTVIINGRAFDDLDPTCSPGFTCGISRVDLQIINSAGEYLNFLGMFSAEESWVEVYLTNPGGQFSNWSYSTPALTDDVYTIRARAQDLRLQYDQTVNPYPAEEGQEPDFITITVGDGSPTPNPQLGMSSSATPATFSTEGETIAEEFVLTNSGNVVLEGPFTVDTDQTDDPITCPADSTLAIGASLTCTASNFITAAEFAAGESVTVATGHGSYSGSTVDSNQDTLTITFDGVIPDPELTLATSVLPTTYDDAGITLDFSYLLTNAGNVVLDGPFTVTADLGAVTCPGDTALGLGASLTCSASYTTDAGDVTAGAVTSNASAAGAYDGSPVGSNGDSATATYDPPVTGDIAFRAAASTSGNTTSHTVTVPGAVEDGDFMLAFISVNNASTSVSTPTGWSLLDTQVDGTMQTRLFTRIAAGDAGSEVTVTLGARYKADLVMVAYSGVDAASPILGYASAGQAGVSATHVTPMLITGVDGAMIISYWADKTSATTTMTPSAGVTRHFNSMSGGGRITALLVDGGTTVAAGNHGGLTATADATAGKATMWTIALQAAG